MGKTSSQVVIAGTDTTITHCSLCGRKTPKCKWCWKGGLGDPPMPEMASWKTWRRGLERVLRRELKRADVSSDDEQCTIEAVLFDHGTVPPSAELIALPYLERMCSEGRYNAGRSRALLVRRIHLELRQIYIDKPTETFIERIERLRQLSRAALIEQARIDEERKQQQLVLSWHLEDLAVITMMAVVLMRHAGITAAQRSVIEVAQLVVDRVGLNAARRIKRTHFDRIAAGIAADDIAKRQRKVRVAVDGGVIPRLRIADVSLDLDLLADEEARASEEAAIIRVRMERGT